MRKKRYWVFGYDKYYPAGGMEDFRGDFDTYEEATAFVRDSHLNYSGWDYVDIYDSLNDEMLQR